MNEPYTRVGIGLCLAMLLGSSASNAPRSLPAGLPQIHLAPGNACEVDTDPLGTNPRTPSFSLRHEVGGDADPSDDSRTIWFKPKETGLSLTANGSSTSLTKDALYVLELVGFTEDPTATTISAVLSSAALSTPVTLTIDREKGDWTIGGFTILVEPDSSDPGFVTVDLLDTDSTGNDYRCSFDIGMTLTATSTSSPDVQVILDPIGSHPIMPEMSVSWYFDGSLDGSTDPGDDFYARILARSDGSIGGFPVEAGDSYYLEVKGVSDHATGAAPSVVLSQTGSPSSIVPISAYDQEDSGTFPTMTDPAPYFAGDPTAMDQVWLWVQDQELAGGILLDT